MTASTTVSRFARRRWVRLVVVGPLVALLALSTLRACAGRADERASCTRDPNTSEGREAFSSVLVESVGWIEVGAMEFRDVGFIVRTEKVATFSRVIPLRPASGADHSQVRVYETRVDPLRRELAAKATIAVQAVPWGDEQTYALRTVALRPDGKLQWIGDCGEPAEADGFDAFVAYRAQRGDGRSAVEMFRSLISSTAGTAGAPYKEFREYESNRGQPPASPPPPAASPGMTAAAKVSVSASPATTRVGETVTVVATLEAPHGAPLEVLRIDWGNGQGGPRTSMNDCGPPIYSHAETAEYSYDKPGTYTITVYMKASGCERTTDEGTGTATVTIRSE